MGAFINSCWTTIMDSSRNPLRGLDLATQHYFMQVLGWMWSMVFSLMFLSIYQFGFTWIAHLLFIGGCAVTVSVFRSAEQRDVTSEAAAVTAEERFSHASRCVWKMDSEA